MYNKQIFWMLISTCCSSSCAISVNRRSTLSQFLAEVWSRITLFIPLRSVGITLACHLEEIHPVSGGELLPHLPGDLVVVAVYLVTHQHPQHLHTPELSIMDQLANQSALHYKPLRATRVP